MRFPGLLLVLALWIGLSAWGAVPAAPPALEGVWVEDPLGEPVIDRGPPGAWDHVAVDNPFLFREDGVFYCFYEAENTAHQEQVGLAVSHDFLHWTKHEGNPVLPAGDRGSWDHMAAKLPVVGRHVDTYFMLYTGKDGRGNAAIGLATSTDLRSWRKPVDGPVLPGRPKSWDPILTTCPALVHRDGTYYAVYRGMTGFYTGQRLGLMASTDLRNWRRPDDPLPGLDGIYSFAVCPEPVGSAYVALSQKRHAEDFYTSADLIAWRPGPSPQFHPGPIDTPSNPVLHEGALWILYEKGDRIYRARLAPEAPPAMEPVIRRLPWGETFDDPTPARRRWTFASGSWEIRGGACLQRGVGPEWARAVAATPRLRSVDVQASVQVVHGKGWVGLCAAGDRGLYSFAVVFDRRNLARLFRSSSGEWGKTDWVEDVPFTPERSAFYRLRLEVAGDAVRCFIDGRRVIEREEPAPLARLRPGLFTAGAAARFDDVTVDGPTGGE